MSTENFGENKGHPVLNHFQETLIFDTVCNVIQKRHDKGIGKRIWNWIQILVEMIGFDWDLVPHLGKGFDWDLDHFLKDFLKH